MSNAVQCNWAVGCGNTTTDPSGRCHLHKNAVQGMGVPGGPGARPIPATPPRASSSRTQLSPEDEAMFKAMRLRATSARHGSPYIAHALFNLTPVNTPGLGTMAVDDKFRCYIDFEYVHQRGVEWGAGGLVHEAWHALRRHGARGKAAYGSNTSKARQFNLCADAEINDDIRSMMVEGEDIFPESLKDASGNGLPEGKTAEWYFANMDADATDESQQQDGQKGDQQGQGGGGGGGQGQGQGSGQSQSGGSPGQGDQQGGGSGHEGHDHSGGGCGGGSGVTGIKAEWELDEGEAVAKTEMEQQIIASQVAQDIQKYNKANPGKGTGNGVRQWADDVLAGAPPDWRKELRAKIRGSLGAQKGKQDYTYRRPSRRQGGTNAILPGMASPDPNVTVAIDTSGSMSPADLKMAVDEVFSIVRQSGVRDKGIKVFSVDSRVGSKPVQVRKPSDINLTGGGGTDMGVAVQEFAEAKGKNRPDIGIILTDGYTPWPKDPPVGIKVVVGIIGTDDSIKGAMNSYPPPDWASVVPIEIAQG